MAATLKEHVAKKIGAIARPDDIFFTADLPKTRSGKIMRRLLRDIAEGQGARRHDDAGRPGGGRAGQGASTSRNSRDARAVSSSR